MRTRDSVLMHCNLVREIPQDDGVPAEFYTGPCPYCGERVGVLVKGEAWSLFQFVQRDQESGAEPVNHECRDNPEYDKP